MRIPQRKGYILIIDDEPAWRDFSQDTLTDEGYLVRTANALNEALHLLQEDGYDLIVVSSDLLQPEEKDLLDRLIARCKNAHLVVVSEPSLSRTHALTQSRAAFKLGAKDWVSKPMGKRPLLSLINALLLGHPGGTR